MRPLLATALATVSLALAASPALATPVGSFSSDSIAPFSFAGGTLVATEYEYFDPGDLVGGSPARSTDLAVLRPSGADFRSIGLERVLDNTALGSAVLAGAGNETAVAWQLGPAIKSGLLAPGARGLTSTGDPLPFAGQLEDLAVAVDPSGRRAIATDDKVAGIRLTVLTASGAVETTAPVSPGTVDLGLGVGRDDEGGWWTVWLDSTGVTAAHITAAGVVGAPIDIGSSSLDEGAAADAPGGDSGGPTWPIDPDGSGGVWIGLRRRVVDLTDAGARTVVSSPKKRALALAEGDTTAATAQSVAGGKVVVHTLGTKLGPARHLSGQLLAIAVDHANATISVVVERAHGRVYLIDMSRTARVLHTRRLPTCNHAATAQLLAAKGLLALSCGGPDTEAENFATGGDSHFGHTDQYRLLRGGRTVAHAAFDEGQEEA